MILPTGDDPALDVLHMSWDDVMGAVDDVALKINRFGIERVVAVARGGMIPAVLLARRLKIKRIETVQVESYDAGKHKTALRILQPIPYQLSRESGTLFVDDIIDTGETVRALHQTFPGASFAALVRKQVVIGGIDTYASFSVPQRTWVVFPWEARGE